jgi:hypothetical protein
MESEEARELFRNELGTFASPELLGRLLLYFECLGVMKQRANAEVFTDTAEILRFLDFLDDYLQLLLQQARDDDTSLGRAIYEKFTEPRSERFLKIFETS